MPTLHGLHGGRGVCGRAIRCRCHALSRVAMYQLRRNFRSNHSDKSIRIAESNEGSGEEEALHNTKLKAHPGGT